MVDITNPTPRLESNKLYSNDIKTTGLLLALIAGWFGLALILSFIIPDSSRGSISALPSYLKYAGRNGGTILFLALIITPLIIANKSGEMSVISYIQKNKHKTAHILQKTSVYAIIALISFAVFMFSYSTIKTRIPEIMPFAWDEIFMKMDRALFFGNDPWVLFSWIYDSPQILAVMDTVYDMWAGILVGTWALCFVAYNYPAHVRFRFPLALLITWFIGGNIMAILLSSAGPCYYAAVTGLSDPYAQQLATLTALDAESTLRAVRYQEILWNVYESPSLGLGGISAMPSMHCATTALLVLFAWKKPVLRAISLLFFGFIFISSFVLAWHYAVDGLLALPIAMLSWWLAEKILKRVSFLNTKTENQKHS